MRKKRIFSELSRAKVNLSLHVVGRRSNGYHNLDSLVAFPRLGDEIYIKAADSIDLTIVGRLSNHLKVKENIILSAIELLKPQGLGAAITLSKDIPISAGLGGGSSNAAVVLKILTQLWNKSLPPIDEIISVGSDIPVCLNWYLQRMQGIGDRLEKIDEPPVMWILLANNGEQVPTRLVFESLKNYEKGGLGTVPIFKTREIFLEYLLFQRNDLETTTLKIFPQIRSLLDAIKSTAGCGISRMSGSGATCYGLFFKEPDVQQASKDLAKIFPNAWIRVAELFS